MDSHRSTEQFTDDDNEHTDGKKQFQSRPDNKRQKRTDSDLHGMCSIIAIVEKLADDSPDERAQQNAYRRKDKDTGDSADGCADSTGPLPTEAFGHPRGQKVIGQRNSNRHTGTDPKCRSGNASERRSGDAKQTAITQSRPGQHGHNGADDTEIGRAHV